VRAARPGSRTNACRFSPMRVPPPQASPRSGSVRPGRFLSPQGRGDLAQARAEHERVRSTERRSGGVGELQHRRAYSAMSGLPSISRRNVPRPPPGRAVQDIGSPAVYDARAQRPTHRCDRHALDRAGGRRTRDPQTKRSDARGGGMTSTAAPVDPGRRGSPPPLPVPARSVCQASAASFRPASRSRRGVLVLGFTSVSSAPGRAGTVAPLRHPAARRVCRARVTRAQIRLENPVRVRGRTRRTRRSNCETSSGVRTVDGRNRPRNRAGSVIR